VVGRNNREEPPRRCTAWEMTSYRETDVECLKTEMDQGKFPKCSYSDINKWILASRQWRGFYHYILL